MKPEYTESDFQDAYKIVGLYADVGEEPKGSRGCGLACKFESPEAKDYFMKHVVDNMNAICEEDQPLMGGKRWIRR
ncbi:hypothetical protein HN747_01490 [archaeon]|jgi:hypothetical protein|nr:hypothetical protein [archaeon]